MAIFSTIPEAVEEIRKGKMVIVVDDEDRENEGDFIMAGSLVTSEQINFMAKHGRGLVCLAITSDTAQRLDLPLMVQKNSTLHETNFTISVDHRTLATTGISASDRANTIKAIVDTKSHAADFVRPGHIFPLVARQGGVLRRAGHTEAAVDLAHFAGLPPAGVLCEILNEDGTMARVPQLQEIAKKHDLKMITIQDIIAYKKPRETFVVEKSVVRMPTKYGEFKLHLFENKYNPQEHHLALVKGDLHGSDPVLVRMHSECLTGDVFGSLRCDCGPQLEAALKQIEAQGKGVIVYLRQEGRGIGLPAKLQAYALQEQGLDTVQANESLGFKPDLREYGFGAQILIHLGIKKLRLMTNNPRKIIGLKGYGLDIVERVPLHVQPNKENEHYIQTKKTKMGHL